MSNRKYTEVVGYWVYSLYVPSIDSYYIGISKQPCSHRWKKSQYKGNSLEPYLSEWQDMIKTVIQDGLNKEEAVKLEDELIVKYRNENRCINKQRSGGVSKNNEYNRENAKKRRENNREHRRKYQREYNREYQRELYRTNDEYREEVKRKARERYHKKKLEKQQQEKLTLFDLESFDIAS